MLIKNRTKGWNESAQVVYLEVLQNNSSSPRSISISQLNTLLCLHLWPIKLVVYKWPYSFIMMGYLILRCVSRLDAFSVYHIRTRLPGYALGRTTDAPEVRPTRSSRSKIWKQKALLLQDSVYMKSLMLIKNRTKYWNESAGVVYLELCKTTVRAACSSRPQVN